MTALEFILDRMHTAEAEVARLREQLRETGHDQQLAMLKSSYEMMAGVQAHILKTYLAVSRRR